MDHMKREEELRIASVSLHHVKMELREPFSTSFGTIRIKECILVEVRDNDGLSGWGETAAFSSPWYTEETVKTNKHILVDFLIPLLWKEPLHHPEELTHRFAVVRGNHMAKAALEGAVWDLYAKQQRKPLYQVWGGQRREIEVGISLGMGPIEQILSQIEQGMEAGYRRVKVKIKPGRDIRVIEAIRHRYPDLSLMVDANGAYTLKDVDRLKALDDYSLLMIEQPLGYNDLVEHAKLQESLVTPICLDESISSYENVRVAHALGSCQIINVKIGRVGGFGEARKIHDFCAQHHIPLWCGGMLETGIGRAHNIALATLDQFVLPGDISASSRYWIEDIIEPEVTVKDGLIQVPSGYGLGYEVSKEKLAKYTCSSEIISPNIISF